VPTWVSYPDEETIQMLRNKVGKYFSVYDMKYEDGIFLFHVDLPKENQIIEQKFNFLRMDLQKINFIPLLRYHNGEYIIFVAYKKKVRGRPLWINILLLVLTIITTTLSGSLLFVSGNTMQMLNEMLIPAKILNGFIFFSLPLLSILGIHEMGHYFVAKKHGVAASLPYFIPIPPNPVLPLGTMGALISMREPIPDRKSLLDIGIAGPLAGFIVAIPVLIIGLHLSSVIPVSSVPKGTPQLGQNLLFSILSNIMIHVPRGYTIELHPTAFAGWVGLLVTAINLLPAGQLDGGHVARAVLKERHRYASFGAIALLASLSFLGGGSWLFMLLIIIFFIGPQHPPALNELMPLDKKRKMLAIAAIIIFILSFTPRPIY